VVSFTLQPHYLWERNAGFITEDAGCAPEPIWGVFGKDRKQLAR